MTQRPNILLTGASGLVGRHFLESIGDSCYVHAMARRSPREAGVTLRPNIRWIAADIGDEAALRDAIDGIVAWSGIDFVVHLAAYYDFTNEPNPEYERTNVEGTRLLLEASRALRPRRFIYVSSLSVSRFPQHGAVLTEDSLPDAETPYADSKRRAEALVRDYARHFPCAIVRPGAIYTDWCEYPPLYNLLATWTSRSWRHRVIAGRGESAIPYLHVDDMSAFLLALLARSGSLPPSGVYVASTDGCTTLNSLFAIAKRYCEGKTPSPIYMPVACCAPGVALLEALGRLRGRPPFERRWMLKFVDRQMAVDASQSRLALGLQPVRRLHVERRLLFLLANMRSRPYEWRRRNDEASHRTNPERLTYHVYRALAARRRHILESVLTQLGATAEGPGATRRLTAERQRVESAVDLLCRALETAVRIGDRRPILQRARDLISERFLGPSCPEEGVREILRCLTETADRVLTGDPVFRGMQQRVHHLVAMTLQLVRDELEEVLESHAERRAEDLVGAL